ncbi:MAG: helix-turn-helix domain-containing protein [Hydrogenophilales bacterium]|nr:helix-turn-helix domain-containing protein [Hydrogenophilales bacterium]
MQKQVAYSAGVDPSYLAGVESGRRDPPQHKVLEKLLNALDASERERRSLRAYLSVARIQRAIRNERDMIQGVEFIELMLAALPHLTAEELDACIALAKGIQRRSIHQEDAVM